MFQKSVSGQEYQWQTLTDSAASKGFHKILLSPDVLGKMNAGFYDIRIHDKNGQEIPYLFETENPVTGKKLFREYRIEEKQLVKKSHSSCVFFNPGKTMIDNISLIVKNFEASKNASLSGSDDKQNWYVVKSDFILYPAQNDSGTSEIRMLDFPLVDYRFLKLTIGDSLNEPINILKAGYYDYYSVNGIYSRVDNTFRSSDSLKRKETFIKINLNDPIPLDKIELIVKSPDLFNRNASVSILKSRQVKRRSVQTWMETVKNFTLSSGKACVVSLDNFKEKEFYIVIENADNQPLALSEVSTLQLNRYLTAHLPGPGPYRLSFGKENEIPPRYDLQYFNDSIPLNTPVLRTGDLKSLKEEVKKVDDSWFRNPLIMWGAILAVGAVLAFFAWKMISEMKERN